MHASEALCNWPSGEIYGGDFLVSLSTGEEIRLIYPTCRIKSGGISRLIHGLRAEDQDETLLYSMCDSRSREHSTRRE
jgi:hypothetical protein